MNLIEAIKSGKPYRRKFWNQGNGQWRGPVDFKTQWGHPVCERLDDLTADDWEIQEPTVTITRTQFLAAAIETMKEQGLRYYGPTGLRDPKTGDVPWLVETARKLGLGD